MTSSPELLGRYRAPRVWKGDRVDCLYRDSLCVVTSWSDAPIPWPRVRGLECRGGSGLWVNEELARAIRTESAVALIHWFGVSGHVTWRWRTTFGVVGQASTPGSRDEHLRHSMAGAAAMRAREWTEAECDARAGETRARNQGRYFGVRWTPANGGWTRKQLALLGTADDEVVARKLGRSVNAVTLRRAVLMIPVFCDRRRK